MAFTFSEELGCLKFVAGSLGGIVHCGLGSGLLEAGLKTGRGRVTLGFECVNFELMCPLRANVAVCFFLGADEVSGASGSLLTSSESGEIPCRDFFNFVGWVAYVALLRCLPLFVDSARSPADKSDNWDVSESRLRFSPTSGSGTVAEPFFAACASFSLLIAHL